MTTTTSVRQCSEDDSPRVGVVVVNLGTPDAPDTAAVRRYLREFLWDRRVVEFPRWAWWLILHGIILRVRPARAARAYAKIRREDGSPLLHYSNGLTATLQHTFSDRPQVTLALAMRYGSPSVAATLARLQRAGVRRLFILPLYPQYAGSTTGSVFDAITTVLRTQRWVPELRFAGDYHDAPVYIDAIAKSIRGYWDEHGRSDRLLISFHGLPEAYARAGDPYPEQCRITAHLIATRLGLDAAQWELTFQSRFGRLPWLKPYLDNRLRELPATGVQRVDVVCPGFAVDCLETLEEIAIRAAETFIASGGTTLRYIPALNDTAAHVQILAAMIQMHIDTWLTQIFDDNRG